MKPFSLQAVLFLLTCVLSFGGSELEQGKGESVAKYLERLQKTGESGNPEGFQRLGTIYHDGILVPQDFSASFRWYEKSANAGSRKGLFSVGYSYKTGEGVPQDYKKAIEFYIQSANKGSAAAARNIGLLYDDGIGVEKNPDEANKWFEKSYEVGDLEDKVSIAEYFVLFRQGTPYEARGVKILEDAAAQHDDTEAQRFLGASYYLQDRTYDQKKAFDYLQKAASKGNIKAQYWLGLMYMRGDAPTGLDEKKGLELWMKSAETDEYPRAVFGVGIHYLERKRDEPGGRATAMKYLERAAKLGFPEAQYTVGLCYLSGQYVPAADFKKGAQLILKSAEAGYVNAQLAMARLYYQGERGVPQDMDKMKAMLELAAAQNNHEAKELLKNLNDLAYLRVTLGFTPPHL